MADRKPETEPSDDSGSIDLPLLKPPFTKEAMLKQFFDSTYHWIQGLGIAIGNPPALRLLAPEGAERDYDWGRELISEEATPKVVEELRTWAVTKYVERLYDFGMLGIAYDSDRDMDSESMYTDACAFIEDLMIGKVQYELYTSTGGDTYPKMALEAAQTALARHLLEDKYEAFYHFAGQGSEGELTIRDIALLARMEEKSVRNAANPKRLGHLKTQSRDGSTFVTPADAKEWLKARGRYIPLTRGYEEATTDLTTVSFHDCLDAWHFIVGRYRSLGYTATEFGKLVGRDDLMDPPPETVLLLEADFRVNHNFDFNAEKARDRTLMTKFAKALELPAELFAFRMKEAALNEELLEVRSSIKQLNPPQR